jgi:hypothetical protein
MKIMRKGVASSDFDPYRQAPPVVRRSEDQSEAGRRYPDPRTPSPQLNPFSTPSASRGRGQDRSVSRLVSGSPASSAHIRHGSPASSAHTMGRSPAPSAHTMHRSHTPFAHIRHHSPASSTQTSEKRARRDASSVYGVAHHSAAGRASFDTLPSLGRGSATPSPLASVVWSSGSPASVAPASGYASPSSRCHTRLDEAEAIHDAARTIMNAASAMLGSPDRPPSPGYGPFTSDRPRETWLFCLKWMREHIREKHRPNHTRPSVYVLIFLTITFDLRTYESLFVQ